MAKHSDFKKALKTFKKIAICSHDAGGAEVLSEIINKVKKNIFLFYQVLQSKFLEEK